MDELWPLLKRVSRSFYLSLRVLPKTLRPALSLTYLMARAADAIADTSTASVDERVRGLQTLLRAARGENVVVQASAVAHEGERELLAALPRVVEAFRSLPGADLDDSLVVLKTLVEGMHVDLDRFGAQRFVLPDDVALLAHCYAAAGCVGEYWAKLSARHVHSMHALAEPTWLELATDLGRGLQLTNIIRDFPRDLADGRCYVPAHRLKAQGIDDVFASPSVAQLRNTLLPLVRLASHYLNRGWIYAEAIPTSEQRLRLAVVWPLWLAQSTLLRWVQAADPITHPVKVARSEVYRMLASSTLLSRLPYLNARAFEGRRQAIESVLYP